METASAHIHPLPPQRSLVPLIMPHYHVTGLTARPYAD